MSSSFSSPSSTWGDPEGAFHFQSLRWMVPTTDTTDETVRTNTVSHDKTQSHRQQQQQQQQQYEVQYQQFISLLFQISSPKQIPFQDQIWSEFFHYYNILIHLEQDFEKKNQPNTSIFYKVCLDMTKHSIHSSNLATLIVHVCRMIRDIEISCWNVCSLQDYEKEQQKQDRQYPPTPYQHELEIQTDETKKKKNPATSHSNATTTIIALIGKARVTAGLMNVLRIFLHHIILTATKTMPRTETFHPSHSYPIQQQQQEKEDRLNFDYLQDVFTFVSRDFDSPHPNTNHYPKQTRDTSIELISTILSFLSMAGDGKTYIFSQYLALRDEYDSNTLSRRKEDLNPKYNHEYYHPTMTEASFRKISQDVYHLVSTIPELYDLTVQCLSLLLVLFSSQLYQPMISSTQWSTMNQHDTSEINSATYSSSHHQHFRGLNFFLDKIMVMAWEQQYKIKDLILTSLRSPVSSSSRDSNTIHTRHSMTNHPMSHNRLQILDESILLQWTSQSILAACLKWFMDRPSPPVRSIAAHNSELAYWVAMDIRNHMKTYTTSRTSTTTTSSGSKKESSTIASPSYSADHFKLGSDGMYEDYTIVMARAPSTNPTSSTPSTSALGSTLSQTTSDRSLSFHDALGRKRHESIPQAQQQSESLPSLPTTTSIHQINRNYNSLLHNTTSKILHASSSLVLLPLRLLTIMLKVLIQHHRFLGYPRKNLSLSSTSLDQEKMGHLKAHMIRTGDEEIVTNDVLWLSDSITADYASALFLLLTNNYRASVISSSSRSGMRREKDNIFHPNPFRSDLASLDDNRWETHSVAHNYGHLTLTPTSSISNQYPPTNSIIIDDLAGEPLSDKLWVRSSKILLSTNFELLFSRFGSVVHNEMGALTLYTLLQSSPIFAASLAVRSDLDTVIVPLLRTLYFSSTSSHHYSGRTTGGFVSSRSGVENEISAESSKVHVLERPFRSSSQLYVLLILLLIFSQDASFGPDSFRRTTVPVVNWYKERNLKDISLGSLLILTLLRCITFNINRLQDSFLLSNSCAILLNLSPHVVHLHPYTAMRLASVTVSSMKKYIVLLSRRAVEPAVDNETNSIEGMYAELCRTLLQLVKQCLGVSVIDTNLHLLYSLVYLQREFCVAVKSTRSPFKPAEFERILSCIVCAYDIIRSGPSASADEAMNVLRESMDSIRASTSFVSGEYSSCSSSHAINSSDSTDTESEDFAFTYEEETDPEIFFLPYVWEVIVCAITAGSLEWDKEKIAVFQLLTVVPECSQGNQVAVTTSHTEISGGSSPTDGSEMV